MTNENAVEREAGAQFNLSVMSDDFAEVILSALDAVDAKKVWMKTDDVATAATGSIADVFDVVKAIYLNASKTGLHVEMSGNIVLGGCNTGEDENDKNEVRLNDETSRRISQKAGCRFSIYPLGETGYIEKITKSVEKLPDYGVEVSMVPFATRIDGEVNDIFEALEATFTEIQETSEHVVMPFTISCNSPSNR
ncbi:Ykof family thiamine-binding protein [Salinicoccus halitifaciens]|uniref:Uncharacterized protein YqgV (UPF0045/DUF77 family) n=1 Tax=Salinicoccus halitifaciens TaxID=1073415 RepID=A0ABV2E8F3_9STAP|nr:Ykof family thiamine-binding protein [Salinicoccus halitifaciens]MCD2137832.1 Ykof family thiamine-binding protein [Salinicoccus halitifaciens]